MDDQQKRNGERVPASDRVVPPPRRLPAQKGAEHTPPRTDLYLDAPVRPADLEETTGDPDWWVRRMVKRERITGVLPPALGLHTEDARLEEALDRESSEQGVRTIIEEFNRRVVEARRHLLGGPPVITPTRDPDREVELWRERRADRRRLA